MVLQCLDVILQLFEALLFLCAHNATLVFRVGVVESESTNEYKYVTSVETWYFGKQQFLFGWWVFTPWCDFEILAKCCSASFIRRFLPSPLPRQTGRICGRRKKVTFVFRVGESTNEYKCITNVEHKFIRWRIMIFLLWLIAFTNLHILSQLFQNGGLTIFSGFLFCKFSLSVLYTANNVVPHFRSRNCRKWSKICTFKFSNKNEALRRWLNGSAEKVLWCTW